MRNRLRLSEPGSYYFGSSGGLGFGISAALGVQLGQPSRPVVCVLGEGSAQYGITALWSAVAYKIPVTFLVLRNQEYMILKWFAEFEQLSGAPGLELPGLDVAAVARAYGMSGAGGLGPRGADRARCARTSRSRTARGCCRCPWPPECGWSSGLPAAADRAPEWVASGTPGPLRSDLTRVLGAERVLSDALDLVAYASDASPYRLIPKAIAMPHDIDDVVALLGWARRSRTPLVFRAGGTSLSGQSQSDSVLVDVRRHWQRAKVLEDGLRVRVQPGMVLGHVNRLLARHGRKLGPDPASTDIACIGGVIANNSGGMRCGVVSDSYRTVRSMKLVLACGATIDTDAPGAEEQFAAAAPELAAGSRRCGISSAPTPGWPSGWRGSSRSRTPPATACVRSWTLTRRLRSSAGWSSAPRARSRSSPRPCSTPSRSVATPRSHWSSSRISTPPPTRFQRWWRRGRRRRS